MNKRAYRQYCGFARALEVLGERWAMLIIRDLLGGAKRFTDLHRGLPGIPTNVLTARLKELEAAGIVGRRVLPRPERAVVYELTPYGMELDDIVIRLGRWGAKTLGEPRPDEIVTADSLMTALRTTFQRDAARGIHAGFELRAGPIVIHAVVGEAALAVGTGPLPGADLVIEAGPGMRAVMAGEVTPQDALAQGTLKVDGDSALLTTFARLFKI